MVVFAAVITVEKCQGRHGVPRLNSQQMASVYAVSEEGQMKLPGLVRQNGGSRTWSEAADDSLRVLAEERGAGTSLSWSYLGGKLPGIRFRATGCLRSLQLIVSFAAIPLTYFAFQVLGFNVLTRITYACASLNTFTKGLSIHGQFTKDDAPVFMFLRTLPVEERKFVTQWWSPSSLWSQGTGISFVFLAPALYVCPLWLFALKVGGMEYVHEQALVALYIIYPYCINVMEPMFLTMYFCSVGKGLKKAIKEYEIFPRGVENLRHDGKGQRIDISAAYRNYEIMRKTVDDFSESFRVFFFCAEFTLFICVFVCTLATVAEFQATDDLPVAKILKVACVVCMWVGAILILCALATVSAGLTGEAKKVRQKAHMVKGWVAVHFPEDLIAAKHFFDHVDSDHDIIGFHGFGITISPSLIAKAAYFCISLVVTVGSLLIRSQEAGMQV